MFISGLQAAIDAAGNLLVAWSQSLDGPDQEAWGIYARAVASDGRALGQVLRVDTFRPARAWLATIVTTLEGIFDVYWTNPPQGGQVSRTISIDPDRYSVTPTTTTTLPPSPDAPVFSIVRTVGEDPKGDAWPPKAEGPLTALTGDGSGGLLLHRSRWSWGYDPDIAPESTYLSQDAGLRWTRTDSVPSVARWQEGPWEGGASNGTLVSAALQRRYWEDEGSGFELVSIRSTDGGTTWSDSSLVSKVYCGDCDEFWFQQVTLASDGHGNWMAAWLSSDRTSNGDPEIYQADITVAFSYDDGRTWRDRAEAWQSPPIEIDWDVDPKIRHALAAVAGQDGGWGLAWRSAGNGGVWAARAATAQSAWTVTSLTSPFVRPPGVDIGDWWDGAAPYGAPAATAIASGNWIVAWEEARPPAVYGIDRDIFFARSADDGKTWSDPAPLSAYAAIDGARDSDPWLASDGEGRVLAVWSSHDPLGDTLGSDSDVLSSLSTDGGVTWTAPAAVDPAATDDDRQDVSPRVVGDAQGRWTVAWTSLPITLKRWWEPGDYVVKVAIAGNRCGNAVVDAGEQCDGGDSCDANCTVPRCGNEVLDAGEECDDGNTLADDHCSASCTLSFCGDGVRDIWTEECDDGNDSNDDACTNTCWWAQCGDGFVRAGVEECDDANTSQIDGCLNTCVAARCGDGFLQDGIEACDDGDSWDGNACTGACQPAVCGDGYVWAGVEECDPADPFFEGGCSADCKLTAPCTDADSCGDPDGCGDANASGAATATDALMILRSAVGLGGACPPERCDVNGSGVVSVTDALQVLRISTGSPIALRCPVANMIGFVLEDSRPYGALQFRVDYSASQIDFADSQGIADCQATLPGLHLAYSTTPSDTLIMGFITIYGFSGPGEIAYCRVYGRHDLPATAEGLKITIDDAVTPDFEPIDPLPHIRIVSHHLPRS